jgi:hypothetical protein
MATDTANLLQWLLNLLDNDQAREDFLKNPDDYLKDHGYGDLSSGDIYDSLCLISDNDSHGHRNNNDDDDDNNHHPAPHHNHHGEDAGHFLREYITNNYTYVDDRDTNIDNSVHQDIDTDGGDFDQTIDNDTVVASGDGSTAVGGDNNGNISSAGHDSTTAFGDGDASSADFKGADFGAGSAANVGDGSANGNAEVNVSDSFQAQDNDSANFEDNDNTNISHTDTDVDDHSTTHTDVASHNPVDVDVSDNTVDVL